MRQLSLVAGVAAALLFTFGLLRAQQPAHYSGAAASPRFEVASIKLDTSAVPRHNVRPLPGGLHTESASVRLLMQRAYGLQDFQIAGGPRWVDSDGYNIEAKADGSASQSQIWLMLQSLFEDRFHLKVHRETKELPSYTLIPSKKGVKLASPKDGGCRNYATRRGKLSDSLSTGTRLVNALHADYRALSTHHLVMPVEGVNPRETQGTFRYARPGGRPTDRAIPTSGNRIRRCTGGIRRDGDADPQRPG
jgi:hypothetical protein